MPRAPAVLVLLCSFLCSVADLPAQSKPPKRPRLPSPADTNDARAYYEHGRSLLEREPAKAADAFYWASRIDPAWAEALYARRIAGFMAYESMMVRYMNGVRGVILSRDAQALDTLWYRAHMLNPFFLRDLDQTFYQAYILADVNESMRRAGRPPLDPSEAVELDYYIKRFLASGASPALRGALAASQREFPMALNLYRQALAEAPNKAGILAARARIFYLVGDADSALAQLQAAIAELRTAESDRLVRIYDSKELYEHQIGMIHEQREDATAAREAYGRALQENLSYYPAHTRLGLVALIEGDTAMALSELDLSIQLAPNEVTARVTYGTLLARVGRTEEAETHLRRVAELEPYYALPHYLLGRFAELRQNREQALAAYRAFLGRASQRDQRRAEVTQRIADLGP